MSDKCISGILIFFLSKICPSQTTAGGHQKYNWNQNLNDTIAHEIKHDLKFLRRYFLYSQTTAGGHQRILWTPEPGNRLELLCCRGWGSHQVKTSVHSSYLSQPPQPAVVYFFLAGVLFSIENAKFWAIQIGIGYFVANLRTFWYTFYQPQ